MFQFTTTNVINSAYDFTTGKSLWTSQEKTDDTSASFNVKRVNKFIADNVSAIYKAEAYKAELAKVTIDFSEVNGTEGNCYQLAIYLGLSQGSQDSRYSNDLQYKGKPLSVDFVWLSSTAATVKALVNTINKYEMLVYDEKLLTVSYSGTYLTLEATTEYQRFKALSIDLFNPAAFHGMGVYTPVHTLADITEVDTNEEVTSAAEAYFVGKEGFGTYSYLLHNLRLPTSAHTRAFATGIDEAPIPGALYNQYTIHYSVNRGILGTNAVGDTVVSNTTHVFYVNQTVSDQFEAALAVLGDITDTDSTSSTESSDSTESDAD